MSKITCLSCGSEFSGKFCQHCGEKRIVPEKDYNLWAFFKENLSHFLSLDAKVIRSYGVFFTKPGYLTDAYIQGRRKPYIKPLTLFLTIAVIVHYFLPNANIYFDTFNELRNGLASGTRISNFFSLDVNQIFSAKAHASGMTTEQVEREAFHDAWVNSKSYLFLIVPFWALAYWLVLRDRMRYYVPHFISAMHNFAFFMVVDLAFLKIMSEVLNIHALGGLMYLPLFIGFGIYLWIALKRVYGEFSLLGLIWRMLVLMIAFVVLLVVYRQLITVWTLAQLSMVS